MSSTPDHQVIMFADIVGSTALYESLGDGEAQRVISECLSLAKESTNGHAGTLVTELGDEIMTVFTDPGDAAAAACEIHAKMTETKIKGAEDTILRMRIGLHYGPVSPDNDAMMSETSKIAHWAASNAKPEQTLGTAAVIDNLPRIYQAVSRFVDDETWNFVSIEHMALHEIIWDVESVTAYSGEMPTLDTQRCAGVTFTAYGNSVTVNADRPVISIGRGKENDLIIRNDLASRQHLSAQFSRGRCTITDNSTNGTVIFSKDDKSSHALKRESYTLDESGTIVLGQPSEVDDRHIVRFQFI